MDVLTLVIAAQAAPAASGPTLATYGPILAGVASLAAVIVSLLSRKDKQRADSVAMRDSQADTAIKGLSAAYDRVNAERIEAETRVTQLEQQVADLREDNDELRRQLPVKRAVKRTTARRRPSG